MQLKGGQFTLMAINVCVVSLSVRTCTFLLSITDYPPYKVSKIGVNRLTEIQATTLASDPTKPGILINAVSLHVTFRGI